MSQVEEIIDDLMASDWKFLLEKLYPVSLAILEQTEGFDQQEWERILASYPKTLALTPLVTTELERQLGGAVQDKGLLQPSMIATLAQEAQAAKESSPVIADGGVVSIPVIFAGTFVSLYLINVVGVIVNNQLREKGDKKQDIPSASALLKQINVAQLLKNAPEVRKFFSNIPPSNDSAGKSDVSKA